MRNWRSEKGAALLEAAVTIPLLLLVSVGIFEFGRAYQTWQVITNAAREGARLAVLPIANLDCRSAARARLHAGRATPRLGTAGVAVNTAATLTVNGRAVSASQVTVDLPFTFIVLQPVARLVSSQTALGGAVTMSAQALMRNE